MTSKIPYTFKMGDLIFHMAYPSINPQTFRFNSTPVTNQPSKTSNKHYTHPCEQPCVLFSSVKSHLVTSISQSRLYICHHDKGSPHSPFWVSKIWLLSKTPFSIWYHRCNFNNLKFLTYLPILAFCKQIEIHQIW